MCACVSLQFTGVKVLFDTWWVGFEQKVHPECATCRGCGIMTCPRCRGSCTVRTRPARLVKRAFVPPLLVQRHEELMPCFECGTRTRLDYHRRQSANGEMTFSLFVGQGRAASTGGPMPYLLPPTSGTILCPSCGGDRTNGVRLFQHIRPEAAPFRVKPQVWLPVRALNLLHAC